MDDVDVWKEATNKVYEAGDASNWRRMVWGRVREWFVATGKEPTLDEIITRFYWEQLQAAKDAVRRQRKKSQVQQVQQEKEVPS